MAIAGEPTALGDLETPNPDTVDAASTGKTAGGKPPRFVLPDRFKTQTAKMIMMIVGAAAAIGIIAGVWMWTNKTEYRVLFSNFSDKDGGTIVSTLQQMNVPYKLANGGATILIPEDQVYEVRLRLASQGLPKGAGVGFELMENQKIGTSQFLEQVNFQRALEGELGRSIEAIDSVKTARVHLAIQKASVFVRDQQKPTASVLLNLYPGRVLDRAQVNAIVYLVASSVPNLTASNVTVVDQNGDLLSVERSGGSSGASATEELNAVQIKYVQQVQKDIVKRVESILQPVVGSANVRAEATAEVDFSRTEQADEMFKPNQAPNAPSIRSQQSSETQNRLPDVTGGIPGALTNQPPVPATAPLVQQAPFPPPGTAPPGQTAFTPVPGQPAQPGQAGLPGQPTLPLNSQKDTTINYEVDRTIRHTQQQMGGVKRLTVAVVVNYKQGVDADGKTTMIPLSAEEKEQVTNLVKEAMGFNRDRGDSVSVANTMFADDKPAELPIWKQTETITMAKDTGKYVAIGLILLLLYLKLLKPIIRKVTGQEEREAAAKAAKEAAEAEAAERSAKAAAAREAGEGDEDEDAIVSLSGEGGMMNMEAKTYEERLEVAKKFARENPRMVANIVKGWMGAE